ANWSDPATRNILAIFGQTTLKLNKLLSLESFGENLALTAGVRYDNYDDIGSSVNPRAGLVYGPTQELNFKLLYGTAFRAPSFREMYNKNNPSFTGNPDIKPEKISTLEAYIGYKLTDNLETNLTYFNSRIEDLLAIITTTAGVIHHDNFGSLTSNGLEFEFKGSWGKNKYGYINATYQNAKNTTHATITDSTGRTYTQEDFNPGSIADIIGNVGINYDFTENIMANLSLNYMGERKRSGEKTFDSNDNLVVIDQRDPLPSLILLNACLTLGHFDFLKDLEMQLAVFNILDQDHRDPDGSGIITYDIPREGRSYMGKISYGF
ncbi:TonB-dependent receptor, partial [candidate division FCPU426 bacterium]|nr:TonB-dependent receptor [candidate division FCPU426 bacterium]